MSRSSARLLADLLDSTGDVKLENLDNIEAAVNGTAKRQSFTATAGQTTFNVAGGFDSGYVDVYMDGVKLHTSDFADTSGTAIVLALGASENQLIDVIAYGTFTLSNLGIADINTLQTSLDAKIDDTQVLTDVPLNAVFTDTIGLAPDGDGSQLTGINAVVVGTTLPSPVSDEGSLFYTSGDDQFYISDGTQWNLVSNAAPGSTGGTVVIAEIFEGVAFSYNLGLDFDDDIDTDAQLTYTLANGTLPSGCVLPTAGNTAFTGIASLVSSDTSYSWVIKSTDTSGASSTQNYQQLIKNTVPGSTGGTITISNTSEGASASYDVDTDFTFPSPLVLSAYSLLSGTLPAGTSLNASTGVISGTAGNNASFSFTIRATVTDGGTADQAYSWIIDDVIPTATGGTVTITGADGGAAISYDVNVNFTFATGSAFSAFSVQSGSLPTGTSLNTSTGVISGTVINSTVTYTFIIRATDTNGDIVDQSYSWAITYIVIPVGQVAYTTAGTYNWVPPVGVTSVSVVCVGGGGRGQDSGSGSHMGLPDGGDSSVLGVIAYGGSGGVEGATSGTTLGGGYGGNAQGGGYGGDTYLLTGSGQIVGGAGAGGYSGKGGDGGQSNGSCAKITRGGDGAGGAAAGGGGWSPGAGVGIYGEGASGVGFVHAAHACPNSVETGTGGSGGEDAPGFVSSDTHTAGAFGGGGESKYTRVGGGGGGLAWANALTVTPGTSYTVVVGDGGKTRTSSWASHGGRGAVRIIWGENRSFPSTNTVDQ